MHIVLKNPKKYVIQGSTAELSATILNVDGQWLVFKGLMGDPDIRMEVTHKQAGEFSDMALRSKLPDDATNEQKMGLINKTKKFMDDVTVYRRK